MPSDWLASSKTTVMYLNIGWDALWEKITTLKEVLLKALSTSQSMTQKVKTVLACRIPCPCMQNPGASKYTLPLTWSEPSCGSYTYRHCSEIQCEMVKGSPTSDKSFSGVFFARECSKVPGQSFLHLFAFD